MVNRTRFYLYHLWNPPRQCNSFIYIGDSVSCVTSYIPCPTPAVRPRIPNSVLHKGHPSHPSWRLPCSPQAPAPESPSLASAVPDSALLLQDCIVLSAGSFHLWGSMPSSTWALPGVQAGSSEPVFYSGDLGNLPWCFPAQPQGSSNFLQLLHTSSELRPHPEHPSQRWQGHSGTAPGAGDFLSLGKPLHLQRTRLVV